MQIVRGVHFIHSLGVLHLDLKPFNIMFANIQDDYNLRIIDFGLAEQLEEGREDVFMTMCGTLEYMSPEVMDCKHASRASGEAGTTTASGHVLILKESVKYVLVLLTNYFYST